MGQYSKLIILIFVLILYSNGQNNPNAEVQGEYALTDFVSGMITYSNISIKITDKFISVRGGCNIHTGYFNVSQKNKLAVGPFSSTLNKCEKDYDTVLIKTLTSVSSFTFQNGLLTFSDKDGKWIAKFTKSTVAEVKIDINAILAQLNGNSTTNATPKDSKSQNNSLINLNTKETIVSKAVSLEGTYKPNINSDSDLMIIFEDNQTISISKGCNIHSGSYKAFQNGTISFGQFFSTSRLCNDDFDNVYLDALKKSDSFQRQNKNVILKSGKNNAIILTFASNVDTKLNDFISNNSQAPSSNSNPPSNQQTNTKTNQQQKPVSNPLPQNQISNKQNNNVIDTKKVPQNPPFNPTNNPVNNPPVQTKTQNKASNQTKSTQTQVSIKPTIIQSPQVFFANGEYTTDISTDSDLRVKFQNNSTISIINGCNSHRSDYKAYQNGTVVINNFISTRKACDFDKDSVYISALTSSVSFKNINSQILLKTSTGSSSIVLIPYVPIQKKLSGKYTVNITGIYLIFEFDILNKVSIIGGCNEYSGSYKGFANGQFSFSNVLATTKRQCLIDNDTNFLTLIKNIIKFDQSDNLVNLYDTIGKKTIILSPYIEPKIIKLSGNYFSNIPNDPDALIKFTDSQVQILNTCNTYSSTYIAKDDGSITFNSFITVQPKKTCSDDFDSLYLKALSQSAFLVLSQDQISLKNINKSNTIILTILKADFVYLSGKYSTNIPDDSDLAIQFNGNKVTILNGCNTHSGIYKAFSNNSISFGPLISTLKFCNNDKDSLYTKALASSINFNRQNGQITFKNSNGAVTLILGPYKQPQQAKSVYFNDTYKPNLNLDNDLLIRLQSTGKVSILNGCNVHSGNYEAKDNGSIKFFSFISTKIACNDDKDSSYLNLLSNSTKFKIQKGEKIVLSLQSNQRALILQPYTPPPPVPQSPQITLAGTYSSNILDNPDIKITFKENQVSIQNGCNSNNAEYKAFKNGTINVGAFMSTRKFCQNDFDNLYRNALATSLSFVQSGETITFRNSKNQVTLILNPYVVIGTVTFDGTYKSNLPNITNLRIIFNGKKMTLQGGCNDHQVQYTANSTNINFGKFVSTQRKCIIDYDSVYIQAFLNSKLYIKSDVRIILQDQNGKITTYLDKVFVNPTQPVVVPEVKKINFSGNFTTNIKNNTNIYISFSNQRINLLNGCNTYGANYQAYSNGTINIQNFIGTKLFCGNDLDYIYLNALGDSIVFTQSKNDLTLKNSVGQVTIILTSGQPLTKLPQIQVYYSITPNLKIYEGFYIINEKDPYLSEIMDYLQSDYSYFLKDNTILAALHRYRGQSIEYQILLKTLFGTFNSFVQYRPKFQSRKILLKSLAIIDINSSTQSYQGCSIKDPANRNCASCENGYGNFKGRCYKINKNCLSYIADECVQCTFGQVYQGTCPTA